MFADLSHNTYLLDSSNLQDTELEQLFLKQIQMSFILSLFLKSLYYDIIVLYRKQLKTISLSNRIEPLLK